MAETQKLTLDYNLAMDFISQEEIESIKAEALVAAQTLANGTGPGNTFLGWDELPLKFDKAEFARIQIAAKKIRNQSEVFIVIGIGGSYLGAKAAIDFLTHSFYNQLPADQREGPEIYFAGTNISGSYLQHLIELIGDRDFCVNMISKSGTTTEPALAFRILKEKLLSKYGNEEARNRIYITTDRERGGLKHLANEEGYESFVVPDNVGGRFSVLTAVGLLPIAVAGIDIEQLMEGAKLSLEDAKNPFEENPCFQYVAIRNLLYRKGKHIELLVNYEPRLQYFSEWWKQLFGESEGKEGKGIFPASANFTADLHSLGQYIQDGHRHLFETCLNIENTKEDITITQTESDLDNLNYLAGKSLHYVNQKAAEGTRMAHHAGGVPNLIISIPEANAFHLGYLIYFFEKACAVSAYLLGVNPFDQPGVEAYKTKMFELLGKPGF